MSFLYVIASSEQGPVKLGYSKNPQKRLKQLQTGNGEKLNLYHYEEIEVDNIKKAEKRLHTQLGFQRLQGEWFNMNVADAILETVHVRMQEG